MRVVSDWCTDCVVVVAAVVLLLELESVDEVVEATVDVAEVVVEETALLVVVVADGVVVVVEAEVVVAVVEGGVVADVTDVDVEETDEVESVEEVVEVAPVPGSVPVFPDKPPGGTVVGLESVTRRGATLLRGINKRLSGNVHAETYAIRATRTRARRVYRDIVTVVGGRQGPLEKAEILSESSSRPRE